MDWHELWENCILIGLLFAISAIINAIKKSKGEEMSDAHYLLISFAIGTCWLIYSLFNKQL